MECTEAQERILESLESPLAHAQQAQLMSHIAVCPACRSFHELQEHIDRRLAAALPPATLNTAWRVSLIRTIRREPLSAWPDFLPDLAHLAGCGVGVVGSSLLLPWDLRTVLLSGTAFTVLTFFLQAIVRSYTDRSVDL
jgi:hypothetical protein